VVCTLPIAFYGIVAILPSAYRVEVIQSGSMEPLLKTGSLIVIRKLPSSKYGPGDVVTYIGGDVKRKLVTHRITRRYRNGNAVEVVETKGDANAQVDLWEVGIGNIIGKQVVSIPYLGYVLELPRHPLGLMAVSCLVLWGAVLPAIQDLSDSYKLKRSRYETSRKAAANASG
jgi:signal peptidase I